MPAFIALEVSMSIIRALCPVMTALKARDKELADQLQRAVSSVPLNLAEGAKRNGRDQAHFYRIATGSAAEARVAIALAEAWGSLEGIDLDDLRSLLDRQAALLHRLTHRRPRPNNA